MLINHHRIKVSKTAHYYTFGDLNQNTRCIWFVFHGYGQTAASFIESFSFLDPKKHMVVAIEGLSRFYRDGFDGPVAASWMTREDRLDEIADYSKFIQGVFEEYTKELPNEVKVVLFGFSQGASTVYRWVTSKFPYFHHLINWAGWIPEDIHYDDCRDYLMAKKSYFVYGLEDKFLPQERVNSLHNFVQENDLNVEFLHFDGKHEVFVPFLKTFISKRIK